MGKRRENRVVVTLSVRVSGTDQRGNPFVQTAQTVDVSRTGARISGIRCLRATGDLVNIESGKGTARFVVVWIGQQGSAEDGHFGARTLQPDKRIFKVELPNTIPDPYKPLPSLPEPQPFATPANPASEATQWDTSERRLFERLRCYGTGQIRQPGVAFPIWAKIIDVSMGGCYLELIFTLPRHAPVELQMTINDHTFAAKGTVATSHPGIGIGVRFTGMEEKNRAVLREIMEGLWAKRNAVQSRGKQE